MFELDDIVAGYGDSTVLRGVSLRVPPGRVVALLGPNGAGKTTLLRVASGLLQPVSGEIRFGQRSLRGSSADEFARAGICHIPEGRGIFRSMTVRENLLLQAPSGASDALAKAVDAFPRLGERFDQRAGTMSGGEQQMLAVARAYLADPTLVLLDEVSLGLAPLVVDEIFEFLRRLADGGASLLLVEQYVTRALAIADFVFILNQGEVAFAGEPAELDEAEVFRTYVGADIA
ncbi:MAG: ABC transporter ATP-binding protein [Acidimicrobiales bacterium]